MLKKIGRVLKGVVKAKAKLVTGNIPGAAKSAVQVVRDTVELTNTIRSSRRGPLRRFFRRMARGSERPGGDVQHLQVKTEALKVAIGQMHTLATNPHTMRANLPMQPFVLLHPVDTAPGGRCGFDTVFGGATPQQSTAAPEACAPELAPVQPGEGEEGTLKPADGASLLRMMESDPERFRSAWEGLSESDRQLAMMNLQRQLQAISQLSTMITNMLQSQHGAAMAVARNLAV